MDKTVSSEYDKDTTGGTGFVTGEAKKECLFEEPKRHLPMGA